MLKFRLLRSGFNALLMVVQFLLLFQFIACNTNDGKFTRKDGRVEAKGNNGIVEVNVGPSPNYKEYDKAAKLLENNNSDAAINVYKHLAIVEENKLKTNAYVGLATCYLQKKNTKEAILNYEKAVTYNPENIDCYIGLGSANLELKDFENSAKYYKIAQKLDSSIPDTYWGLAIAYEAMDSISTAKKYATKFIELVPDSKYRYVAERILKK